MNPWVALIGHGDDGRSRLASELAERFRRQGVRVGGFVHHRLDAADAHRGHDIEDLRTRERAPLTRLSDAAELCDYAFAPGIFERVRAWTTHTPVQLAFVELGKIECRQRGHWPAMLDLMSGPPTLVVACLRPPLLAPIVLALPDPAAFLELPAPPQELDAFAAAITDLMPV